MRSPIFVLTSMLLFAACKKAEEPKPAATSPTPAATAPATGSGSGSGAAAAALERRDLSAGEGGLNVDPAKSAKDPAVLDTGAQSPVFVWIETGTLHAKRWKNAGATFDGNGAFEALGGPLNFRPDRQGSQPRLAADKDGATVAAWLEMNPDDKQEIRVARFADGKWNTLGSANTIDGADATAFDFAVSSEGPAVIFSERKWKDGTVQLRLRRFDGKAWTALGDESAFAMQAGNELAGTPAIAAVAGHAPVVVWKERASGKPPTVGARRWDAAGAKWIAIDAPLGADGDTKLDADMGADGSTYLWMSQNVGMTGVKRLAGDAKSWTELGEPKCGSNAMNDFDVAGSVAVLATDKTLCVWGHDGEWRAIGSGFAPDGLLSHTPKVSGAVAGPAFVVWQDVSKDRHVIRAVGFYKKP